MNTPISHAARPWYREPWPWFLMSLPAAAVVAGLATVWIAARNADGLVVGDYYKAGLAINQTLARDEAARALDLQATLAAADGELTATLTGRIDTYPDTLGLTLAHPTRQGEDRTLTLVHAGKGRYRAALPMLHDGKWQLQLTDAAATWRLAGVLYTPLHQPARFTARAEPNPTFNNPGE
ncbi:MAG: FixH family protein [Pseudomonadota bacterium]